MLNSSVQSTERKNLLIKAFMKTFSKQFLLAGLFKFISDCLNIISILITKLIIDHVAEVYQFKQNLRESSEESLRPTCSFKAYGLAMILFLIQSFSIVCVHQFHHRSMSVGAVGRSSLISCLYKFGIRRSSFTKSILKKDKLDLLNIISTDVSRIDQFCNFFHFSWTSITQSIGILLILIHQIGTLSSLVGIITIIIFLSLQVKSVKLLYILRSKVNRSTETRIIKIQEIFKGIKFLKLFNWESTYLKIVENLRDDEINYLKLTMITATGLMSLALSLPLLGSIVSFVTYASLSSGSGSPSTVFTSLTAFNLLRLPLIMLPPSLNSISEAVSAFQRLEKLFQAGITEDLEEINQDEAMDEALIVENSSWVWGGDNLNTRELVQFDHSDLKTQSEGKIKITEEVKLDGDSSSSSFQLSDINLRIRAGSLVSIVGPVGAGKTSLLEALLGEMTKRVKGPPAKFGGTVGYCPQKSWAQNDTIRSNVLFGQNFDPVRYKSVLWASCLEEDLQKLPLGDLTVVGERAVKLSGGQRQRLNLARALYLDPDIVLLDDPLSAVDSRVGNHLFKNAIRKNLFKTFQTKVLVTHSLQYLPQVDQIIYITDGRIVENGSFEELIDSRGKFFDLYDKFMGSSESIDEIDFKDSCYSNLKSKRRDICEPPRHGIFLKEFSSDNSLDVFRVKPTIETQIDVKEVQKAEDGEELMSVSWMGNPYLKYLGLRDKTPMITLLIGVIILNQSAFVIASYWLVWWQEDAFHLAQALYMGVYAVLGVLQTVLGFIVGVIFVTLGCSASRSLHKKALRSVLQAPLAFFDTTPLGKLIEIFSKDVDTIDNNLNDSVRLFVFTLSNILGAFIAISITSPWFLIPAAGVISTYYLLTKFYQRSAGAIQRLDNSLRSSLYEHFSESMEGLSTIKAYGMISSFTKAHCRLIDEEKQAYLLKISSQRWLGVRLDLLGSMLILLVSSFVVFRATQLNPSQSALVLSYVFSITPVLSYTVRQISDINSSANSVERLSRYAYNLPQEPCNSGTGSSPPFDWPSKGSIRAKNIFMRYRPSLPEAIKGMSFEIQGGERIGIVGRTGAGKSSLLMCLLRMVELESGDLSVDGYDISKINLERLRNSISVIPQDAVIFQGTLRSNLDPLGEYEDLKVWEVLKRVGLDREIQKKCTLESEIEVDGVNLSFGERSMISLGRAMLRGSKIVILDEATASVDYKTDERLQETIQNEFRGKTVLCIAHRLKTVIGYDRILVMDNGTLAEFDTPLNLFSKRFGIFKVHTYVD
ncbi:P-loop containing nucleoside triphosphate hydrolase protein [Phakopsora pachyrhizi]|uniref:P-loop containing nucleoside triphosphate hydrolase protein n=1 Tax=Phakopsora pachyrhizi TaxID=170000 RepID=A0AAV0AJG5_PHAPC|nr:P-loop containing nucleoside triphosphate hydrolase protein [Phakopsora pachyrhizi]